MQHNHIIFFSILTSLFLVSGYVSGGSLVLIIGYNEIWCAQGDVTTVAMYVGKRWEQVWLRELFSKKKPSNLIAELFLCILTSIASFTCAKMTSVERKIPNLKLVSIYVWRTFSVALLQLAIIFSIAFLPQLFILSWILSLNHSNA